MTTAAGRGAAGSGAASGLDWRIAHEDRPKTTTLARELDVPRIVAHLMQLRGITTCDEGRRFLSPSLDHLADPLHLTDMKPALERLEQAKRNDERVLVFGDYDVDGIAGTAILMNALRRAGIAQCAYDMPSRITEGYGLSPDHVVAAAKAGVKLIITVDNGINAREAADAARRLGVDLIVTDHHQIEGALPYALAIVNPKREVLGFPGRDASGAAVAFALGRALNQSFDDLDLVALGTVADIVPLRGENRVLATFGLEEMAKRPRIGLTALAEAAGIDITQVNSERIAFQLGPRLNAAGRLGDGLVPLELLLTQSHGEAARMAGELNDANDQRRVIEKQIYEEAIETLEHNCSAGILPASIVLAKRGWHPGVIGIVASRLVGRYNRPVVLVAIGEDGIGRGSARSAEAFDMAGALASCREHLLRFGGHSAAAGLALVEGYFDRFRDRFEEEARKRSADITEPAALNLDALVALSEIDPALVKTLDRLEPFGCMNPSPLFCTCGVSAVTHSIRELQGGHLKFEVKQGPRVFPVIAFRMAEIAPILASQPVDIAYTPKFNTWRGETSIQLVLKDVRAS